jgi:dTDP-4-amino-4,6-dideoxygalactose transaminase
MLGYNYRLTDIQAALGISQLKRADANLKRRYEIANLYFNKLKDIKQIILPYIENNIFHAFHLFIIQTSKRKELYDFLRTKQIYCQVHYIPIHTFLYYKQLGWKKGDFPIAEAYYAKCLSLPMYPSLSDEQVDYVIENIKNFFSND